MASNTDHTLGGSNEDSFTYYYQCQKFKESDTDPFISCSVKRKCLAQIFHASFSLASNDTSCLLLDEGLSSYSALVDKQGEQDINNYSKAALALVAHTKSDPQKWKSNLKDAETSVAKFLKPLTCSLANESKTSCSSWECTEEDISSLFAKSEINLICDSEDEKLAEDYSDMSLAVGHHFRKNENEDFPATESFVGNRFEINSVNRHVQNNDQKNLNTRNFCPTVGNPSFMVSGRQVSRDVARTNRTSKRMVNCDQVKEHTLYKKSNEIVFHDDNKDPKVGQQNTATMFRTARDELNIQNMKKWNNKGSNYSVESGMGHNYGGQKRSLGTRRGVMNKFIPPVKPTMEGERVCYGQNQQEEWEQIEVDDRLKHIDPKMVELIRSEIMDSGNAVTWDDIAGLEFAKSTIQEIVVWPLLRPDIFTGLRRPPKGILLFGPPGTGKTLIGKCIASQSHSTFFSISASSLTSKWIGDGEKMVRALFAVARCHQPAVVFIDEIDSLLTQRSDSEHESSRRIKTEFLVQLDGAATGDEDRILVIGATNRPQELDEAARRRLVKKLYIPLPEFQARRKIVENLMKTENHCLSEEQLNEISLLTDGYSGADMKNLCQEASLGPIRSLDLNDIQIISPNQVRPVMVGDFKSALTRVRASVSQDDLHSYVTWDRQYGSGGSSVSGI